MSPRAVEMMVACPGGPPHIAIPGVAEHSQVLRGVGQTDADPLRDFTHQQLAQAQQIQDLRALGVGQVAADTVMELKDTPVVLLLRRRHVQCRHWLHG